MYIVCNQVWSVDTWQYESVTHCYPLNFCDTVLYLRTRQSMYGVEKREEKREEKRGRDGGYSRFQGTEPTIRRPTYTRGWMSSSFSSSSSPPSSSPFSTERRDLREQEKTSPQMDRHVLWNTYMYSILHTP